MDLDEPPLIWRREHAEVLDALNGADTPGVLLLGAAGAGKTSLLRSIAQELDAQGRAVFFVGSLGLENVGDLGDRVVETIVASRFAKTVGLDRTIRSSARASRFAEVAAFLRAATRGLPAPVLLLDGFDESPYRDRMAAAVEELSLRLDDWKIVVASRWAGIERIRPFANFRIVKLAGFDHEEARQLLEAYVPELPETIVAAAVKAADGNPVALRLLAGELQRSGRLDVSGPALLGSRLERLVSYAIDASPEPEALIAVLEQLALAGGRDRAVSLAAKSQLSESKLHQLLDVAEVRGLIVENADGTVGFFHAVIRELILARRIFAQPFRLTDLAFGSEEAERDELLNESYVRRPSLKRIFDQRRSIVIGDRGSGKSAIFRRLVTGGLDLEDQTPVKICPVADATALLHRIVEEDAGLDPEALRAAWLVVVASVVASAVPASASRELRRTARELKAAFGFPTDKGSRGTRLLRTLARPFAGTTLSFAVGPVNLEAQLPAGSGKASGTPIDIETFLRQADDLLTASSLRVVVMFDRIDETFKYNRASQEALVQALLQAEGRVSMLESIGVIVFLRTDLFELYDIQERTKMVSRTLTLDWSEEEWLELLVNRVFANQPVQRLAEGLRQANGALDLRGALEVLFPAQIENQPVDRWLIDAVRNGNGDVSPRLAVLLLHLARDLSVGSEDVVSTLPLFSAEAVRDAMTRLSDLSYSEVVNDFKIATSFVLNCRAGKLESFALSDVEELFDQAEGNVSQQVRLLERLGFLERVVHGDGSDTKSVFKIPKLYTRCWDYA